MVLSHKLLRSLPLFSSPPFFLTSTIYNPTISAYSIVFSENYFEMWISSPYRWLIQTSPYVACNLSPEDVPVGSYAEGGSGLGTTSRTAGWNLNVSVQSAGLNLQ